jgi:hypothetical protein
MLPFLSIPNRTLSRPGHLTSVWSGRERAKKGGKEKRKNDDKNESFPSSPLQTQNYLVYRLYDLRQTQASSTYKNLLFPVHRR